MNGLNPKTVIEDCLENAFNLRTYIEIIDTVQQENFVATADFRKKFNGFYKVRQKPVSWYEKYYNLMEEQKNSNKSFKDLLLCLESVSGTVDVSFVSKMMAAIDPSLPIWDKYVLQNLNLAKQWERMRGKDKMLRIDVADCIYKEIQEWYNTFINSIDGKKCIAAFDTAMPSYRNKLTDVKKIDYLLWSKR
jgi:hypothetical protein